LLALRITAELMAYSAIAYISLAFLIKGSEAIRSGRRALSEVRVNLLWGFLDGIFVGPLIAVAVSAIRFGVTANSLQIIHEQTWSAIGTPLTFFLVIFIGDFTSYWRHRLEHTRWLWPAHAIHHSDPEMTWLTIVRFHPINRAVTSCVDILFLAMLGFPIWALVANELVRHYYGEFIHADLPFTYGPLGRVFVSPAMHQWHHARGIIGAENNFATVFSVFDQAFGTYHVPGVCNVPLGVTDDIGRGIVRQFIYPFVCWFRELRGLVPAGRESQKDPA